LRRGRPPEQDNKQEYPWGVYDSSDLKVWLHGKIVKTHYLNNHIIQEIIKNDDEKEG